MHAMVHMVSAGVIIFIACVIAFALLLDPVPTFGRDLVIAVVLGIVIKLPAVALQQHGSPFSGSIAVKKTIGVQTSVLLRICCSALSPRLEEGSGHFWERLGDCSSAGHGYQVAGNSIAAAWISIISVPPRLTSGCVWSFHGKGWHHSGGKLAVLCCNIGV
eukprot:1164814-Amphidinium_carterae.1